MIAVRRSNERGHANHGWLRSYHTFSFADYHDPEHMGFRSLRVINEDVIAGRKGFGRHPHRDMEIITYIVSGAVQHRDSMGRSEIIRPGDVQVMSAGSGVEHSEMNPSEEETHLLQIWIVPQKRGGAPSYAQRNFSAGERTDTLRLVVSGTDGTGALRIGQDADLYASLLSAGKTLVHTFAPTRSGWLLLIRGELEVNGIALAAGDGARIEGENVATIRSTEDSEFLLFDLA